VRARRSFFSNQGFSIVGTLVALSVGAVIAYLLTHLINEAVRSQRGVMDRDEITEFTLFVKNVLTTDATCSAILAKTPFPVGGRAPLKLPFGYRDRTDAVFEKGFTFNDGAYEIEEFSIEDRSPKPVQFSSGDITVRRHLARVKLQLKSSGSESPFRPRYFEFPVLVNSSGTIEMCNNDIHIGDACQALGFRWDTSVTPPACVVASSCLFGGSYTSTSSGGCNANPSTGACSCPAGYVAVNSGSVNIQRTVCTKGCDNSDESC
jgi:hypothetical protein